MSAITGLVELRAGVVAALKAKLPSVNIDTHGGTFDLAEIKRYAAFAPAIRVAITGVAKGSRNSDGRWLIPVNLACVIVTCDTVKPDRTGLSGRDEGATALAVSVLMIAQGNRFGFEGVSQPDNLTARNEYSGAIDNMGVALWQVSWVSTVILGDTIDDTLDTLKILYPNGETAFESGNVP